MKKYEKLFNSAEGILMILGYQDADRIFRELQILIEERKKSRKEYEESKIRYIMNKVKDQFNNELRLEEQGYFKKGELD